MVTEVAIFLEVEMELASRQLGSARAPFAFSGALELRLNFSHMLTWQSGCLV